MSSECVIRARGLGKSYRLYRRPGDRLKEAVLRGRRYHEDFWALRGVDLSIGRGETIGVIGRNGSGKSTLLQLLCGTLQASEGELEVRGRIAALLELGAGFNPEFTGRENVWVSASVLGLRNEEIRARFDAIAAFAGIGEFMEQPVKHYSSGMYARLAFAVCAHVDADILIVDEILAVGDAAFQQKCMRYLHEFRRRGTLLFVSHDTGAVVNLCDRALWLDQGIARAEGDTKEVCKRYMASLSEQATDQAAGFRIGGRRSPEIRAEKLVSERQSLFPKPLEQLEYDPDTISNGAGGAMIENVGFYAPGGPSMSVASGGEDVELRVYCRAERVLVHPTLAFLLRDRLGQVLFCDDTFLAYRASSLSVPAGRRFVSVFRFYLPYLPTGEYALDAMLFDGTSSAPELLHRLRDKSFLSVQSSHISGGLINVAARSTTLTVDQSPAEMPIDASEDDLSMLRQQVR